MTLENAATCDSVTGGSGTGTVSGNTVTVSGGSVCENLVGGDGDGTATVSDNTVHLTNSTCTEYVTGGYSEKGNVSGNTVTIQGGTYGTVTGGEAGEDGDVSGNTVTIAGGTVKKVIGGECIDGKVTGNTVNLVGKGATLNGISGDSVTIQEKLCAGSCLDLPDHYDNTVNIYGSGINVGSIENDSVQDLNFHVGTGTEPMLTFTESGYLRFMTINVILEDNAVGQWMQSFTTKGSLTLANQASLGSGIEITFMGYKEGDTFSITDSSGITYSGTFVGQTSSLSDGQIGLVTDNNAIVLKGIGIEHAASPEPATATLSLLALAALASRRRRK